MNNDRTPPPLKMQLETIEGLYRRGHFTHDLYEKLKKNIKVAYNREVDSPAPPPTNLVSVMVNEDRTYECMKCSELVPDYLSCARCFPLDNPAKDQLATTRAQLAEAVSLLKRCEHRQHGSVTINRETCLEDNSDSGLCFASAGCGDYYCHQYECALCEGPEDCDPTNPHDNDCPLASFLARVSSKGRE